jgi:hypothetical protein
LLSQQARTRAILGALGIPLWGTRGASPQAVGVVPIWGRRDDHDDHIEHAQDQVPDAKSAVRAIVDPENDQPQPLADVVAQPIERMTRLPFTDVIATSESAHVEHVIRFSLEARVIGQWVVLVSVQALNHPDRNALWKNISASPIFKQDSQEVCRFDWPLAEGVRWQQNIGAQAALIGFLTRFGTERRIGLMGELPDAIIPDRLERLPSLDELLQEPLKKRSLWRLLSGALR